MQDRDNNSLEPLSQRLEDESDLFNMHGADQSLNTDRCLADILDGITDTQVVKGAKIDGSIPRNALNPAKFAYRDTKNKDNQVIRVLNSKNLTSRETQNQSPKVNKIQNVIRASKSGLELPDFFKEKQACLKAKRPEIPKILLKSHQLSPKGNVQYSKSRSNKFSHFENPKQFNSTLEKPGFLKTLSKSLNSSLVLSRIPS